MVLNINENIHRKIADIFFPSNIYCICCNAIIDDSMEYSICSQCFDKFQWVGDKTCKKCGKRLDENYWRDTCEDCLTTEHIFDRGFTCTQYGLYEKNLMMKFKYSNITYLGKKLGKIMYDRFAIENLEIDGIIVVPIHLNRLKKRGYNQVEILASTIAKCSGKPLLSNVLGRKKDTIPMNGLGIDERKSNVEDAFFIKESKSHIIKDKNILIIDDIYTTGSTVDACAKELKAKGANKVYTLTFSAGGNIVK